MNPPTRFVYPSPSFSHYWSEGRGVSLKKTVNSLPNLEEINSYIPYFNKVDTLADRVIKEVYQKHGYQQADNWITALFTAQKQETFVPFPEVLLDLKAEIDAVPAWVDWKKLEDGARLCRRTGGFGLMVLRNYCLMGGYESAAINKPLIATGALKKGAAKRLTETTEFWLKIVAEDCLKPTGNGVLLALKIRLMHAYARVSIQETGTWDASAWGEPINQWDMLATNLGFSIVFLDGLRSLGLRPSEKEINGLFHFWKYLGVLMGIPETLLPEIEEEAIRSLYAWTITQPAADSDTIELAKALMEEPLHADFPKKRWQKKLVKKVHLGYNHYFLGKQSCTFLALPNTVFKHFPFWLKTRNTLREKGIHRSERKYNKALLKSRKQQEDIVALFLPEVSN